VKVYVAALMTSGKNERQDETQFTIKIGGNFSFAIPVIFAV